MWTSHVICLLNFCYWFLFVHNFYRVSYRAAWYFNVQIVFLAMVGIYVTWIQTFSITMFQGLPPHFFTITRIVCFLSSCALADIVPSVRFSGRSSNTTVTTTSTNRPISDQISDSLWPRGTHAEDSNSPQCSPAHPWVRQKPPNEKKPLKDTSSRTTDRSIASNAHSPKGTTPMTVKVRRSNEQYPSHPSTMPQPSVQVMREPVQSSAGAEVSPVGSRDCVAGRLDNSLPPSNITTKPVNGFHSTPITSHRK